ncbi:hypothetical protein GM418_18915 [Maribellus comscasis]|uniref:Carboxypeptidase-like regulatory domain-containing protein n=1 Tax=Maribellus comscasis TaxID=2681766 RepID=A0A6I6JRQ9_9BACT|nr:hypothetical protein [Maribellus comscasis]QGY45666.1 hypothetical protein GM418_18915 [Maribellus comscasis]
MKLLTLLLFVLTCSFALSQEKEFHIQGRIIDGDSNPVADVYILNYRNLDKAVSRQNGIFDMWVLPGDSLMLSHVSYLSLRIKVFDLMVNPVIQIALDTVNIIEVDVFSNPQDDMQNAKKNIESMGWNPNPTPTDNLTEKEMMQDMVNRENNVMRSEATSLKILKFSPSDVVGAISKKIKKRKKSNKYSSKKKQKKNYP